MERDFPFHYKGEKDEEMKESKKEVNGGKEESRSEYMNEWMKEGIKDVNGGKKER